MKKIGEIKEELSNTKDQNLWLFIDEYKNDERSGVIKLVETAIKRRDAFDAEILRTKAMRVFEEKYADCDFICGIDEVGRGPLAGPVVAAAVVLPKDCNILYINDSKKLSATKREELSDIIRREAVSFGIGSASWKRIDEINILNATYEAMREAIGKLSVVPDVLLNDAVTIPGVKIKQHPIIKGDAKSMSIAAASIVAKVHRDHLMDEYDVKYPGYGFSKNKGYGSAEHIKAIKEIGPCEIHRNSFIKNFL